MKNFLRLMGKMLSLILPLRFRQFLISIGNHIRAGYYSNEATIGVGVVISSGSNIISAKNIMIEDRTRIGLRATLSSWPSTPTDEIMIRIGRDCSIGDDVHITSSNSIIIGNHVLIGKMVTITDNSHGKCALNETETPPNKRQVYSKGAVIIADNVWIGDKVTILPGVEIGKGAIIGANSVLTKSVGENCIVAGNPARVIRMLKEEP